MKGRLIGGLRLLDDALAKKGYPEEDRAKILDGWLLLEGLRLVESAPPWDVFKARLPQGPERHE